MRIAFIVQYCHQAGTFFRWHNLAKALQDMGHEVVVFAGDMDRHSKRRISFLDGVKYEITPVLISSKLFLSPTDPITGLFRYWYLPRGFDVYHLFQPFTDGFLPWFLMKIFNRKASFFYDWDDLWTDQIISPKGGIRRWFAYQSVKFLERKLPVLANGTSVCSTFLQGSVSKNAKLIYNGFWKQNLGKVSEELLFNESNKGHTLLLGYTGRTNGELIWLSYLCERIELLQLSVSIIICGPSEEQMVDSGLNRYKNVRYMGVVAPEKALAIAASVDIGLLPLEDTPFNKSRFPIKFFDYLTSGTTVFCSEVGEIGLLGKDIQGVVLAPGSKEEWVKSLLNLLMSSKELPKPEIALLQDRFSWIAAARELESFYGGKDH